MVLIISTEQHCKFQWFNLGWNVHGIQRKGKGGENKWTTGLREIR